MSQVKYIAAGFQEDSEKLLDAFIKENSTDFTVFCTKWKEHNFGLIFAGRDHDEQQQFTSEVFEITLGYFNNQSTIFQVGAVYLLYALYRNQKTTPPVQIRVTLPQWEIIKNLKDLAEKNRHVHLHYIINFLHTNAFDFVTKGSLFGPICSKVNMELERYQLIPPFSLEDCKKDMKSFQNSNLLNEIKTLFKEYVSQGKYHKKEFFDCEKRHLDLSQYSKYVNDLDTLLNAELGKVKFNFETSIKSEDKDLGNRRSKIKANQFSRKARFRQLNASDSESDEDADEDWTPIKQEDDAKFRKVRRKKRVPKEKRRVGRPRKYKVEKVETDESDFDKAPKVKAKRGPKPKPRGPTQRASYLTSYELKVPSFSKKIFKDFLPESETSEEEPPDSKEETEVKDSVADETLDIYF